MSDESMTEVEAVQRILEAWEDGWDPIHVPDDPTHPECVPYTYDAEPMELDHLGPLGAWVRVSIQQSTRDQRTTGGPGVRKFDTAARVFVQIFTPPDRGTLLKSKLADDARKVLEGQRLGSLRIHEGVTRGEAWFATGPARENGSWLMAVVVFEIRWDETR